MSDRGAEEAGTTGADGQERRAGEGKRVHFEALVAVGEMVGGGFEAESIDVSPEGMRLRTAYLPAIGDKLVCRFDGMGAEVVAEGEVIWKNQEARGGEFGLRFVDLDPDTAEAVRAMCGSLGGEDEEAPRARGAAGAARRARAPPHRGARLADEGPRARGRGEGARGRLEPGVPQGRPLARARGRRPGQAARGDDRPREGRHRSRDQRAAARGVAPLRQRAERRGRRRSPRSTRASRATRATSARAFARRSAPTTRRASTTMASEKARRAAQEPPEPRRARRGRERRRARRRDGDESERRPASARAPRRRPNMPPSLSPTSGTPASFAAPVKPSTSCRVLADRDSKKPGLVISFNVASPQAVATGLPLSVPAWYIGPEGPPSA